MAITTKILCVLVLASMALSQPQGLGNRPDIKAMIESAKKKKQKDDDMKEYMKIEEYKNHRLWACDLLAQCRLLEERVVLSG